MTQPKPKQRFRLYPNASSRLVFTLLLGLLPSSLLLARPTFPQGKIASTTLTSGTQTTESFYDAEGRRVKKVVTNGGTATTTLFIYNGAGQLAQELTNGGTNATRYLTQDHLGSTRVISDATGLVKARCDYRPFGELLQSTTTDAQRNLIPEYACSEGVNTRTWGPCESMSSATCLKSDVEQLLVITYTPVKNKEGAYTGKAILCLNKDPKEKGSQIEDQTFAGGPYVDPQGRVYALSHIRPGKHTINLWNRDTKGPRIINEQIEKFEGLQGIPRSNCAWGYCGSYRAHLMPTFAGGADPYGYNFHSRGSTCTTHGCVGTMNEAIHKALWDLPIRNTTSGKRNRLTVMVQSGR